MYTITKLVGSVSKMFTQPITNLQTYKFTIPKYQYKQSIKVLLYYKLQYQYIDICMYLYVDIQTNKARN